MTALAHAYFFVLLGYAALYAALYLAPVFRALWGLRAEDGLARLLEKLKGERRDIEAELAEIAAPVAALVVEGEDGRGGAPYGGDGLEEGQESEPSEAAPDAGRSRRRLTAERLNSLPALRADYESGLVQEAVDQLRVQYPTGAYQQVSVEGLPSHAAYAERVGAARTMAGLFVLLGLLLTMVRLNGVVDEIGRAAGETAMTPDSFLEAMGSIMTGVGGAFLSSIWGLGLMLAALLAVALADRIAQRRFAAVDRALNAEIVPELADLHTRLMPDLTLGDLLAETGAHLGTLNRTVDGLTDGMARSLAGLGERIEVMLHDFRTFQDQYVQLNDLLKYIREASENLSRTTSGLEGASKRLANPLDEFNRNLLAHIETVADAVAVNREGYQQTAEQLVSLGAHDDVMLMEVRNLVSSRLTEHSELQETAVAAVLKQAEKTDKRLERVAEALEKASNVRIEHTLAELARATERLGRRHDEGQVPPSFFSWLLTLGRRVRRDGFRSLFTRRARASS